MRGDVRQALAIDASSTMEDRTIDITGISDVVASTLTVAGLSAVAALDAVDLRAATWS